MKRLFGSLAAFIAVSTQSAVLVLDQRNVFDVSAGLAVSSAYSDAQTLTCGLAGILSRVDVEVIKGSSTTSDLVLSLWSTASDGTLLTQLASSSLPASAIPYSDNETVVSFDSFSQAVDVNPGELIGIRLDSAASNAYPFNERYAWFYQTPGQYAGGRLFVYGNISMDQAGSDFYFQTFVTPVPEPGVALLSFLAVILWIQHRHKRLTKMPAA